VCISSVAIPSTSLKVGFPPFIIHLCIIGSCIVSCTTAFPSQPFHVTIISLFVDLILNTLNYASRLLFLGSIATHRRIFSPLLYDPLASPVQTSNLFLRSNQRGLNAALSALAAHHHLTPFDAYPYIRSTQTPAAMAHNLYTSAPFSTGHWSTPFTT